jgi:cell division protein FtsQ
MKAIAWNRVVLVAGILGLTVYLIVSLLVADEDGLCKGIGVKINNEGTLVYPEDINAIIEKSGIAGTGKPLNDKTVNEVKKLLETKSYLKDIVVYKTGDSILHVEFNQRIPALCLLNEDGASCYLDRDGYAFPRSLRYAYNVPIVTGNIKIPQKNSLPTDSAFTRTLLSFAGFISANPFWNAQIQQINIDKNKNVELTVCSDDHCIRMGQLTDYEEKMRKLYAFYTKLSPSKKAEYKIIDLRFKKQIVAHLKTD